MFSAGPGDIGGTSLVTHQINTGDAQPIKQQPLRLPLHKKLEAEKEITHMLERDIIEASCSPWASPIVLAKKLMALRASVLIIVSSTQSPSRTHTHSRATTTN